MDKKSTLLRSTIPPLSIIIAVDNDGGFGKDGTIPWNYPADIKHFKEITKNSVCIMGRITYENMRNMVLSKIKMSGSPPITPVIKNILAGRTSFVVTSKKDYVAQGATVVSSLRSAIEHLKESDNRKIFVLGGYGMYIQALSWTRVIYMTIIKDKDYKCDRHFPIEILKKQYKIATVKETDDLYFVTYNRR